MAAKLARSARTARGDPEYGRSLIKVGDLLAAKYRVERVLGEGGMGVVVAAYHELLDQRVAVKLLYGDIADREAKERLLLEARASAKLQSEHVARVVDVDVGEDGLPFIVMDLLEGADLCQIADARGALPRWLVVDYILQALEGLAHAHAHGIIHRDLKPSNLFLASRPDGSQILKILDFGISKSQTEAQDRRSQQLTGSRAVLGSPPYMSPEQVRSPKTVDHRTDIWSLGICMYELLTNSMPFGGSELQETFAQILEREPTMIRAVVSGVPEGLERVVMTCLAKNRDARWSDVGELAKALAPYGSGTWIQSADRICATLARPVLDDTGSGQRLKGGAPSDRMAIPSSPHGRLDSIQPELTGTASTVARPFGVFDSQKRWIVVACVAFAMSGIALIAFATMKYRRAQAAISIPIEETAMTAEVVASQAPPSAIELPANAASATATPIVAAAPESESTPISSAGPAPLHTPVASSASVKRPPPTSGNRPVSPGMRKPAAATSSTNKPALPAGLPQTRSGQ